MGHETAIVSFSVLIIAASFGIGWWAKRKISSPEAFLGGTKIFGPFAVGLSTMAAVASAFAIVGVPGMIYRSGNTILLFMLAAPGFAFGYLVIGKKMRAMAELGRVASLGDVADLRFNHHRGIKLLLSVQLFVGCIMYLAAQIKACADLFAHLLGWQTWLAALVIFGILIVYTVLSGEVGGILTQAFQGLIMVMAGLIITVGFFVHTDGFGAALELVNTPASQAAGFKASHFTAWGGLPGAYALTWVFLPVLGIMCQPQVLTRMYALKSPHDMPKLSLVATVANMVVGFMVMAIGYAAVVLVAKGLVPPLTNPDRAVFAVADHLGMLAQLFVYAAVLAAAMSTSSLFLTLAGATLARDVSGALGFKPSAEQQVRISRVAMTLLGAAAIAFSATSGEMVAILGTYGFGTLLVATFPVFILGLLWDKASSQGVFSGLVVSVLATIVSIILDRHGFKWPGGVPWYINVATASMLATLAVSMFTHQASGTNLPQNVRRVFDL